MSEVSQIGYAVYLCILSIIDIWLQRVPLWLLAAGGAGAVMVQACRTEVPLVLALAGAGAGAVFLVISRITREAFGYGDSLLIVIMGIFLGLWNLLGVLLGAFLFSSAFAVIFLIYKGLDRKAGYPFVPFLLISYSIWLWFGGF